MDKQKFRDIVTRLKDDALDIDIKKLPNEVLSELLQIAVERIDYYENASGICWDDTNYYDTDERDAGDIVFDQNHIVYELLNDLLEKIDLGLI